MINPLPWTDNDERDDSGTIRDANGEVIAKDYTFLNLDDFEAICRFVNPNIINPMIEKYKATMKEFNQVEPYEITHLIPVVERQVSILEYCAEMGYDSIHDIPKK